MRDCVDDDDDYDNIHDEIKDEEKVEEEEVESSRPRRPVKLKEGKAQSEDDGIIIGR